MIDRIVNILNTVIKVTSKRDLDRPSWLEIRVVFLEHLVGGLVRLHLGLGFVQIAR